jgi:uncharacterized membrane protein
MECLALSFPFSFDEPQWLWLAALVPVLVLASFRSLAGLDPARRVAALLVRCVLVLLVAACLAEIHSVRRNDDLTVMFLMDRSHSVQELETFQEEYIREVSKPGKIPPQDRVGLIDFARGAYLQQLPMRGGYHIPPGRLPQMQDTDRTNIASSLQLAMALFPADTAKRVVLLSDGNDNMGDVLTAARRAKADGVPIDVVPLWYRHRNEVYFDRMHAPTYVAEGEQVPLRMVLHTNRPVEGQLQVFQNGKLVPIPPESSHVRLESGSNTLYVKLPVQGVGDHRFEAVFRPDDESMDAVPMNNSAGAFSFVSGSSRILVITTDPREDLPLVEALRAENITVELRTPEDLPSFDLLAMTNFSAIILSNVPATAFSDSQQEALAAYVTDMGSGLIMTGGDEGFGAGGWIGTPIEDIMPVHFEIKHKRVIPRGALVLIMHSCEIARGNFWGKEMAKKSVDTISSQDYLGVIAYTYSPVGVNWEAPLDLCTNKRAVKAKIDRMQIGDMPDFQTAMQLAYDGLTTGRAKDAAQRHVIIISDGDPSAPSDSLIQKYADKQITVSTIGIGWGAHVMKKTMAEIARKTKGRFHEPRNPKQLPQIFVKESKIVRRPLISNEPFQPQVYHQHSDLLLGLDPQEGIPGLGGMVLTSPRQDPNVQLPLVRATTDGNDPVLACWQVELGKTVAFTSGYWRHWGENWMAWPQYSKLWAQIVRWCMRQDTPANFDTYTRVEGSRARIIVEALDQQGDYLNFLQFDSRMRDPGMQRVNTEFRQTGPGRYEAEVDVDQAGQYVASMGVYQGGQYVGTIRTGMSVPFSPEYRDLMTNEGLLRQVAEITGGRWLAADPAEDDIFSHDLPPSVAKQPVWDWIVAWLLLPLFLLDVAIRRLASWLAVSVAVELVVLFVLLFGLGWVGSWGGVFLALILAEAVGWTIRFRWIKPLFDFMTHGVVALSQAGTRSESSLAQLKTTKEKVQEEFQSEAEEGLQRLSKEEPPRFRKDVAQRRFDVGEAAAQEEAGDLHTSLGGAKTAESWEERRRPPAPADKKEQDEGTTSRLLRAKRRAQQDRRDDDKDGDGGGQS